MKNRHSGYVIGSSPTARGIVWKVRVKDPESEYDKWKLVVASIQGSIALAQGLNVDFVVGSVDGQAGEEELRAVDVRVLAPKSHSVKQSKGG